MNENDSMLINLDEDTVSITIDTSYSKEIIVYYFSIIKESVAYRPVMIDESLAKKTLLLFCLDFLHERIQPVVFTDMNGNSFLAEFSSIKLIQMD